MPLRNAGFVDFRATNAGVACHLFMRFATTSAPIALLFLALLPGCPGCGDDGGASAATAGPGGGAGASAGGASSGGSSGTGGAAGQPLGTGGKGGSAAAGGNGGGAGSGGTGGGSGKGGAIGNAGSDGSGTGGTGGGTAGSGGASGTGGSSGKGGGTGGGSGTGGSSGTGGGSGTSGGLGGSSGAGGVSGSSGQGGTGGTAGSGGVGGPALSVQSGVYASCALFTGGEARCWGGSYYTGGVWNGQTAVVLSSDARAVPLGGVATALSRGNGVGHACAVRGDGAILCWGEDGPGVLLGDSAPPPVVPLAGNAKVAQIATSAYHTCVVTDQGKVRCWGAPGNGALGYGNLNPVTSDVAGDVDVGGPAIQVSLGEAHTCALLVGGAVRCWGSGYSHGVPGTNVFDIGDDELPTAYGTIDVGGTVKQIATGNNTTCALLDEGTVKCWGETVSDAALGLGYHFMPDFSVSWVTPALDLGGKAIAIAGGGQHYCAILEGGGLQCWGDGGVGQLGRGNTLDIGDDETPSSVGNVPVGATVVDVALGTETTCVVTTGGGVRCWGRNDQGQCGRSPVDSSIGDDETPASLGDLVFQ